MYLNGRNLLIYAGGEVVAAAKSCRISMDFDTIETANVIDGKARTFIPGRYEWQVSVNTLVTSVHSCFEGHGQTVRLSFVVRDRFGNLSADRMTGEAFVKNISRCFLSVLHKTVVFYKSVNIHSVNIKNSR